MSLQRNTLFKTSLVTLCFMIFGMILIGGLTRLTGSGLSIVEWKPITGLLPPLTHADWVFEFTKYQDSPEFQKINFGMKLDDFKSIFYLEYIHRLWGRLIGFLLLIPTFLMAFKRQYRNLMPFLIVLWALGLAQGVMGWIMVKSGLNQDPHVSPYRLSAHLFLGFMIFGVALWMILRVYGDPKNTLTRWKPTLCLNRLKAASLIALSLVLLTAFFGALVAGLKAGLIYNTFPLMGVSFIPREFLTQSPWWQDVFENPVSVQFLHRLSATITTLFCASLWLSQRRLSLSPALTTAFNAMMLLILAQFSLGLLTLLYNVPVFLALLHQGVAFLLFGSLVYVVFLLRNSQRECRLS